MSKLLETGHQCDYNLSHGAYGPAIESTYELDDNTLWVGNSEYASQVNYCPYCGYKAQVQVQSK